MWVGEPSSRMPLQHIPNLNHLYIEIKKSNLFDKMTI